MRDCKVRTLAYYYCAINSFGSWVSANCCKDPILSTNAKSILFMLSAVFCFTVMDALAKKLTLEIGLIPTIWARYAGQAVIVFVIVLPRISTVVKTNYPRLQIARSIFLMTATSLFFLSISKIGLAQATAIMDINPVLITLGAVLFLGEKIGNEVV